MSRVGKHAIEIPSGIDVVCEGNKLNIKKGAIEQVYVVPACLKIERSDTDILFKPIDSTVKTRAIWGTSRRNVGNIIHGLATGFKTDLELVGVGYKAAVTGKKLILQLGYSHDIEYEIPDGISITCSKPTSITVSGHSKKQVGDVVAILKKYRKPEPYKGKGIMKSGEFVYRKEGKKK
jgi:large subunit ribosomal protein L6